MESALPVDTQTSSMCTRTPSNREPPQEPHTGEEEQGGTILVDLRPHVFVHEAVIVRIAPHDHTVRQLPGQLEVLRDVEIRHPD